jgi:serine/threonine-protein kinase
MKIKLMVIEGPHRGAEFEFETHATFLVGRSAEAHLRLTEDGYFSRNHFLLELNPPRCYLRDLGSRNGTNVNGRKVQEAFLQDGDVISGGSTRIRVCVVPDVASDSTVAYAQSAPVARLSPDGSKAHAAADRLPAGTPLLPGYEIVRTLGRGSMGVVYLARHQATGRLVALKVMTPQSSAGVRELQVFLREASILSRLDHPRIVRFLEMGLTTQEYFYFAMEYVEQVELDNRLARLPTPARIGMACDLIAQILTGLTYAHELGFVHRDIKPSNILVCQEGANLGAKLADFGLAKNFEHAGFSGITRQGQLIGTIAFMAPEQAVDACHTAPSVDIYGAGATLYEFLTGESPHTFPSGRDPLLVLMEDPPVPLHERCPAIPEGLCELVHRALARKPAERFPSAAALLDALLPHAGRLC